MQYVTKVFKSPSVTCDTSENLDWRDLQLLGATSIFIAAKVEEIHPPKVSDLLQKMDDLNGRIPCSSDDILAKEAEIVKV